LVRKLQEKASSALAFKLGISSYSYWHFKTEKVPIEKVIDETARLGVEGVDILHRQMEIEELGKLDAAAHVLLHES
jgi:hypothetical protein